MGQLLRGTSLGRAGSPQEIQSKSELPQPLLKEKQDQQMHRKLFVCFSSWQCPILLLLDMLGGLLSKAEALLEAAASHEAYGSW